MKQHMTLTAVVVSKPKRESYGTVAAFEDLYGNRRDLVQAVGSR